jgi:Mrp family chromosome partitioning ATPase
LAAEKEKKCILVTSGSGGDGKTFVTLNTAMSMAISGKRTIAIGMDLRKPKLSTYIGEEIQGKGLTSYLVGAASKEEIVNKTKLHENFLFHQCRANPSQSGRIADAGAIG